jgi:DnaJ-class molecular chaperone
MEKNKTCNTCNGSGLILRKELLRCPSNHSPLKRCMYCENCNKSLYEECDVCYGSGTHNEDEDKEEDKEEDK